MKRRPIFLLALSLAVILGEAGSSFGAGTIQGEEKDFQFTGQLELPAAGVKPTRRTLTETFELPSDYQIVSTNPTQHGVVAFVIHDEKMKTIRQAITPVPNGVKVEWELENPHRFPVNGRTGKFELTLRGKKVASAAPQPVDARYQKFRDRFISDFLFEGMVAESIEGNSVKFGDQTIYMGQALMVFALEDRLHTVNGTDAADSRRRITTLLNAFDRLDNDGEKRLGGDSKLDGFFVRDNISGPGDARLRGRFTTVASDWQQPELENFSPSGDQIVGMMIGLWAVHEFCGDPAIQRRARKTCSLIYDYAHRNNFVLKLPSGAETRRGADMRWYSTLVHGLNKSVTNEDRYDSLKIDPQLLGAEPKKWIATFWDSEKSVDLIAGTAGKQFDIPILFDALRIKPLEPHSFALHLILMTLSTSDVWNQDEFERASLACNHQAALLLDHLAHNRVPTQTRLNEIKTILAACPDTGPAANVNPATGWNHDNRWVRCTKLGDSSDGNRQYNGLDWLLLENSRLLVASDRNN